MTTRGTIAIDFDRRYLRALQATWDRNRLGVRRALVERVPDDVDPEDPKAIGTWAGRVLSEVGFPRGKAVISIAREHVVLKRISLPSADPRELPQMTRFALQRDLPFDADTAVIDFVCAERGESSTTVMAVAASGAVISGVRQAARAAGLGVERISLRGLGTAALLRGFATDAGAILALDITGERVDFSVVIDGAIRFSRAGELPPVDGPSGIAEAVVTEARRTWMSYRIVNDSENVRRAVVIGDRQVSERVAGSIASILGVDTEVLYDHPLVEPGGEDPGEVWPLAGLLLAPGLGVETIDFARPRKAPDLAARKRQIVLGGAGVAAIIALSGVTMARFELAGLEQSEASLAAQKTAQQPEYYRYGRDRFKLEHLRQWESAGADWLSHFDYVVDLAPPPDRLVLDSCIGTLTFNGVKFDRQSKRFSAPKHIRVVLEGEAADRSTADAFRETLVDTEVYTISTSGPDARGGKRLPYGFQYNLNATDAVPGKAAPVRGDGERAEVTP